ncbi:MAG: UDP-N-acetylmuramoyl-L-alanine--D-glutamate ligase [Thermoleophilia bacterium]
MRFSDLEGRRIGVWGLGRETRSFLTHLERRLPTARVVATVDDAPGVTAEDRIRELSGCEVVVRSPGVSIHRPEFDALRRAGIPHVTPTALWMAQRGGRRVFGVTGTKGKSTTATILTRLLQAGGRNVHLAGNIGLPALDLLDAPDHEWAVVELSSYQIADLERGPEVALLTNLSREHIDWHGSEGVYRAEKLRLLALPGVRVRVVPADAADALGTARRAGSTRCFGWRGGWEADPDGLFHGGARVCGLGDLPLPGVHNARNVCAALTAVAAAGLPVPDPVSALAGLAALPHRLQRVHVDALGVEWVDDSISTTPQSALAALAAHPDRPVVLIGGGMDRQQEHAALGAELARRHAVVAGLPTTGSRLVAAARAAGLDADRAVEVPDMAAAVAHARRFAGAGWLVLLSPAAPSYNTYRSFEERGDHFAALARGEGTA